MLPHLSLVMPAVALRERLSLRHAGRTTRGATRCASAIALRVLPPANGDAA